MPKVNFNPQGTLIQDEALFVPPQSRITGTKFKLSHDVFSSVDFSITYNGEALVPQVDYVLTDVYERARQEMGLTVYQRVQFLPNAPLGFTSTVYVTYRAVGDFVDANEITNQTDNDERYLKRIYNLSDIPSPQSALKNLESAASETTDPEDFGYDDANEESFSDVMVQTNWGDGIPMKVPFKEFADETARAAIPNPLPVSKGGTNAQSIDGAISNILSGATSVDDDAVRDDGAVPFQCPSAYQHQNVGKITLLQIFNNWLKSKLQSWLGITVTESGGSITGRTFDGNATTAAKTSNAITFSNSGNGAASGSTFNGSAARTLSYNSIGAASSSHTHSEYATTAETLSLAQYFKFISSIRSGTITSVTLSQYSGNLYRGSSAPAYNAITIYELVAPSNNTIVNVDTHRSSHDVFLVPLWSRRPYTVIVACCSFNSLSPQGWYFYATCI